MALFNWKEEYSVKVSRFDDHHKKLIGLINELHESMIKGTHQDLIGKTISALLDYTKYHFSEEEKLMISFNYPEYEQHKAQHDAFTGKVRQFMAELQAGRAAVTIEVVNFLRGWLKGHVMTVDKRYTAFFAANKVA